MAARSERTKQADSEQSVSFKWWINGKLIRLAFMLRSIKRKLSLLFLWCWQNHAMKYYHKAIVDPTNPDTYIISIFTFNLLSSRQRARSFFPVECSNSSRATTAAAASDPCAQKSWQQQHKKKSESNERDAFFHCLFCFWMVHRM